MTRDADQPAALPANDETFLQRWSRRKHAAARESMAPPPREAVGSPPVSEPPESATGTSANEPAPPAAPREPLPPVESLTFESDFTRFLEPHVGEDLKRQALKKLLHDPRFNVMDGLDVYIDDYSLPSPLEPDLIRGLAQARYIFEPPPTRVNAAGHVEDVPAPECDASEVEGGATEDHAIPPKCADGEVGERTVQATPPAAEGSTPGESTADGDASR